DLAQQHRVLRRFQFTPLDLLAERRAHVRVELHRVVLRGERRDSQARGERRIGSGIAGNSTPDGEVCRCGRQCSTLQQVSFPGRAPSSSLRPAAPCWFPIAPGVCTRLSSGPAPQPERPAHHYNPPRAPRASGLAVAVHLRAGHGSTVALPLVHLASQMAAPLSRSSTKLSPFHELGDGDQVFVDRAFTRSAGAPLVAGNSVRLLRDATENYPAWLAAIENAEKWIHFESYIIHDDEIGMEFADALIRRARDGVRVRLLYDWMGALGKTSGAFWRRLTAGGVEVRCFNPPRFAQPLAWVHRDHRKMLGVDGRVGFVTGLCVGRPWVGAPEKGIPPWRDTGIEIRGPAVADVEWAFRRVWKAAGGSVPHEYRPVRSEMPAEGSVRLRIVASEPWSAGLMRLDQLIAAAARERLWLSDAYFAGIPSYMQA